MCIRDSPVVFRYGYAVAAKYAFYTGGEAYCQPNIRYRTHQWQFRDDDSQFIGREVLVECPDGTVSDSTRQVRTLTMANGRSFTWFVDPAFHPVRLVDIAFTGLPGRVAAGETLRLELRITNPYPYAIRVGADDTQLVICLLYTSARACTIWSSGWRAASTRHRMLSGRTRTPTRCSLCTR